MIDRTPPPKIEAVIQHYAGAYGVTVDEMRSKSRVRRIMRARKAAVRYLATIRDDDDRLWYSLDEIADAIGRSRWTVTYWMGLAS